jgi:hypothetical protein
VVSERDDDRTGLGRIIDWLDEEVGGNLVLWFGGFVMVGVMALVVWAVR